MALEFLRECQAILELEQIEDLKRIELIDQLGAILHTLSRRFLKNRNRTATETIIATPSETNPSAT